MYKVIISKVQFGESYSANFEGEGTTIQAALNRAKKAMHEEYTGGVHGYTYNTYKIDSETGELKYLQTFGG
jgi:hypothetical protein